MKKVTKKYMNLSNAIERLLFVYQELLPEVNDSEVRLAADKFYRTRSGLKVYVYAPAEGCEHRGEFMAVHPSKRVPTKPLLYNSKGRFMSIERNMDIVAEWEDDNIEVDHFYRTRDGQKVYVYKYNADEKKFAGAILGSISLFWHYDGSAVKGSENELDLVAPWKDDND